MAKDNKFGWVAAYQSSLQREFDKEEYGETCLFYPDDVSTRQAKFVLWVMRRYGVEEQFIKDVEQFELIFALKKV